MTNQTFAMIKPGAIHRGLAGLIINRFEQRGLNIVGLKLINVSEAQAKEHYYVHRDKPFYDDLVNYIMSGPVLVLVISGENAIELVRNMAGNTDPLKALSGTIRGDFSADIQNNIIHTSDSITNAEKEINIYFTENEILDYQRVIRNWTNH